VWEGSTLLETVENSFASYDDLVVICENSPREGRSNFLSTLNPTFKDSYCYVPRLGFKGNTLELVRCGILLMEIVLSSRVEGWNCSKLSVDQTIILVNWVSWGYTVPVEGNCDCSMGPCTCVSRFDTSQLPYGAATVAELLFWGK